MLAVTFDCRQHWVPAVASSPERLQPLRDGLELANRSGGFEGRVLRTRGPEARLTLRGIWNARGVRQHLEARRAELLGAAAETLARDRLDLALALQLECLDASTIEARFCLEGAGAARSGVLREAVRVVLPEVCSLAAATGGCVVEEVVRERVHVRCALPAGLLAPGRPDRERFRFAAAAEDDRSPLGSAPAVEAQNKTVLGAISRVALALGTDPKIILSYGYDHAARFGGCAPIVRFERCGAFIVGELQMPLELTPHADARQAAPATQALDTDDLRVLAGCVGLASEIPTLVPVLSGQRTVTACRGPG